MVFIIPIDINLNYSDLGVVKESPNYIIFSGKDDGDKSIIIKIRAYDTKVFSGLGDDDGALLRYHKISQKIKNFEWAPRIIKNYITEENNTTYVISVEEKYFSMKEFEGWRVNKSKLINDITNVLKDLHNLGINHRDVAMRNICYSIHLGKYILIDYNDAIESNELSINDELKTLLRELESINN